MAIWHVAPLSFAPAFRALGVREHIWLLYKNFDPSCFDPIEIFGKIDLRTNSDFRSRTFDLFPRAPYSINGSSVIDLFVTTEELCGWKTTMYTDLDTELLTGYPNRGHVPVFAKWELNYSSQDGKVTKFDLEKTDWQNWQSILEEKMNSFTVPNNLLYKDPNVAWRKMRYILDEVNQLCLNTKVISKHSKQFWTDVLTQLSDEVRALNKTFKRTSTPQNHAAITSGRLRFKQELSTAASNWTSSKLKK